MSQPIDIEVDLSIAKDYEEFSGLIRERHDVPPLPFRELWMLARLHRSDPGWRVARVQALE